jgi:glycosyltransferase involved in cell wall biosynthesis
MSSGKKVLIILENGSIWEDHRVTRLARALEEAGYEICVICPKGKGQYATEQTTNKMRVYTYRLFAPSSGVLSYLLEYLNSLVSTFVLSLRALRDPGFDIIHACNPPDIFFLIAWIYRLFGKKFVFDQHDLSPALYLSRFPRPNGLAYRALVLLERLSYRTADIVLTTNSSYKRIATARGGVPADRVFVVRNGPMEIRDGAEPDPSFRRGHKFLVYYMGRISPQDGVDHLLRAASRLVSAGRDDVYFLVTGDGDSLGGLRVMARDLGLDGHIGFTGWVADREMLSKLLSSADVCVAPEPKNPLNEHSTFIKVMDYMAAGKPIVAYDLHETRFSAEKAALYATPNNVEDFAAKIEELLGDKERRKIMGEYGRRRVKEALSWDRSLETLLEAYRSLSLKSR